MVSWNPSDLIVTTNYYILTIFTICQVWVIDYDPINVWNVCSSCYSSRPKSLEISYFWHFQDGILWCPNATHLTLEHLGQSVPGLIDVNRTDNWLGFYPCPHCEPDSLLRFNWTENCCSMCRANTLKDLTRTDSLSDPGPYIWLHNADSVWSICYNLVSFVKDKSKGG